MAVGPGNLTITLRRISTGALAAMAAATVGYCLLILAVAAYSSVVDKPANPVGFVLGVVGFCVPFVVGAFSHQRVRRAGLAGERLLHHLSVVLILVAFLFALSLVLLSAPV